jgi:hypothetical protein
VPAVVHEVLGSSGQPLDPTTRASMEARLGHDFTHVRVHTDGRAAASAWAVDALAFTVGRHVVFGHGQYAPGTAAGRRLLAHELTHVVQQAGNGTARPTAIGPSDSAQERAAGQVEAGAIPAARGPDPVSAPTILQRQPVDGGQATPAKTPAVPATASAACDATGLTETGAEAQNWLQDVIDQLVDALVDQSVVDVFGGAPKPDTVRVLDALDRYFRTRSLDYGEIVLRRLQLVQSNLMAGKVKVLCAAKGDPECRTAAAGKALVVAYVKNIMELVMCGSGVKGARPVATFIHELCHAVMPNVGTKHPAKSVDVNVTDRAYPGERLFARLTTEEALDNAASYEAFVVELRQRRPTPAAKPADTVKRCADPSLALDALARADAWNRDTTRWLHAVRRYLDEGRTSVTDLPSDQLAHLTRHAPWVSRTNDLDGLLDFYERMAYAFGVDQDIACGTGKTCADGVRAFAPEGTVTLSSVSLKKLRTASTLNLCPAWAGDAPSDRIRVMYALFILSRPAWMTKSINLTDVFHYVNLAAEMAPEITPSPKAASLADHWIADLRTP